MENYSMLFPPRPSSSYLPSSMANTTPHFANFHNTSNPNGLMNLKEEFMMNGSAPTPPPPTMEFHGAPDHTSIHGGSSENEANPGKKKSETKKVRRPRYAFQTRSQVDILDDGYRWRKYGQKAVKNNNFPRSYYRCTYQGCNVKKQVQRLTKDEGIVVTTYEGTHTHHIEKANDNFEHILNQMQFYPSF